MTIDASMVIQALVVVITSASAYYLRSVLSEVKDLVARVNKHSESLAAGNQRFSDIERRLSDLETDMRKVRVPS